MKIFIGSTKEQEGGMRKLASLIENLGHEPLPWDSPAVFLPGNYTFTRLIEISRQVDAALFIFSEDDSVWYRTDLLKQPRDNVILEYGLFARSLGIKRAIVCRMGAPKYPTDLSGITWVDISKINTAQIRIEEWLKSVEEERKEENKPNIAGKWTTSFNERGKQYKETLNLVQQGHKVSGDIVLPDEGEETHYAYSGTFENMILSGTFYSKDEADFERGAFVLRYTSKGKFFGRCIFFSKRLKSKNIVSSVYKWNIIPTV